jgi:hypothetical protein
LLGTVLIQFALAFVGGSSDPGEDVDEGHGKTIFSWTLACDFTLECAGRRSRCVSPSFSSAAGAVRKEEDRPWDALLFGHIRSRYSGPRRSLRPPRNDGISPDSDWPRKLAQPPDTPSPAAPAAARAAPAKDAAEKAMKSHERPSCAGVLCVTAKTGHRCPLDVNCRRQMMSAATAAFLGSGRRVRATVVPPTTVNPACYWWRNLLQLRTPRPADVAQRATCRLTQCGERRPVREQLEANRTASA